MCASIADTWLQRGMYPFLSCSPTQRDLPVPEHPSPPPPPPPDPPLDPVGPSAGRVVVSGDRRFADATVLLVTVNAVLCLVEEVCIKEAKAAAAREDGTTPKYLVTVYARRTGGYGPPGAFPGVTLTPTRSSKRGNVGWRLGGLGPLRQHLGLAPRSLVRLVREVGQDGRVRLVVEPREEEGSGGGEGENQGKRPAQCVEAEDSDIEDEHGLLLQGGGDSSCSSEADGGSEPSGGSDGEEGSGGEGTGSGDPDWVPGEGAEQGAGVMERAQEQEPQPQRQQQQPPLQPQRHHHQHQQPQELGGNGGVVAGPSGAVAGGVGDGKLGRAEEGPGGRQAGRPGKRRRLEMRTDHDQPEERPAAGQDGEGSYRVPGGYHILTRLNTRP